MQPRSKAEAARPGEPRGLRRDANAAIVNERSFRSAVLPFHSATARMPSTPRPSPFPSPQPDNRARLVDAAVRLFGERGYASTSVRLIAQEAGVSQGLLYTYFPGKHALLHEIFARGMQGVEESFERMRERRTAGERLEALVRSAIGIVRRDAAFWRLLYGLRFQPVILADLGEALVAASAGILETLEALLRSLGVSDAAAEARVLFATIDGLAQHALLESDDYPVDAAVAALLARYPVAGPVEP